MYLIGIAGGSGSGKMTFAQKIINQLDFPVSIVHMDSYYLASQPETATGRANFDHPDAFDWNLLVEHLDMLKKGETIPCPVYDFNASERTSEITPIKATPVVLFEGIFSLYTKELREILDIKCFLHVDSDIRFIRRLHRDVKERSRSLESVIDQYYATVRPMYQKFLDPQRQYADFTVGEETDSAATILAAKIKELHESNH